jgi:hypothetical protein
MQLASKFKVCLLPPIWQGKYTLQHPETIHGSRSAQVTFIFDRSSFLGGTVRSLSVDGGPGPLSKCQWFKEQEINLEGPVPRVSYPVVKQGVFFNPPQTLERSLFWFLGTEIIEKCGVR